MFQLFVAEDFDNAGVLGVDGDTVGSEVVEVGAGGNALGFGVPPVVIGGDVDFMENAAAGAVVDGKFAVFEAVVL